MCVRKNQKCFVGDASQCGCLKRFWIPTFSFPRRYTDIDHKACNFVGLGALNASHDHKWVAFAVDTVGNERYDLYVKELSSGGGATEGEARCIVEKRGVL